jgi:hypothetical protein
MAAVGRLSSMSAIDRAVEWLRHQLADGAKSANVIHTEAEAADHSGASVRRAKVQLRIKSEKRDDQWFWSLPDQPQDAQALASAAQDAHEQDAKNAQGAQSPAAELQGAQEQDAHAPEMPSQDAQTIAGIGQHAHAQDAQTTPRRKREIKVCADPSGPDQISHEQWRSLGCDKDRLREFIRQRDHQGTMTHAEA